MRIHQSAPLALVALLTLAGQAAAQADGVTTLDEGRFVISIQGNEVGSEEFYIRQSGEGEDARIFAVATIRWTSPEGSVDLRPQLETTGTQMAISNYEIDVGGATQEEIVMSPDPSVGNRYLAMIQSERGRQEREFRASQRTLLLDTGVAHQYYFLASRFPSGGGTVPVVVPRAGRQYDLRVTEVGTETLSVGGVSLQSRRLRLEGNQETREVWLDPGGRVLKVEHPAGGYSAVREAAP